MSNMLHFVVSAGIRKASCLWFCLFTPTTKILTFQPTIKWYVVSSKFYTALTTQELCLCNILICQETKSWILVGLQIFVTSISDLELQDLKYIWIHWLTLQMRRLQQDYLDAIVEILQRQESCYVIALKRAIVSGIRE